MRKNNYYPSFRDGKCESQVVKKSAHGQKANKYLGPTFEPKEPQGYVFTRLLFVMFACIAFIFMKMRNNK